MRYTRMYEDSQTGSPSAPVLSRPRRWTATQARDLSATRGGHYSGTDGATTRSGARVALALGARHTCPHDARAAGCVARLGRAVAAAAIALLSLAAPVLADPDAPDTLEVVDAVVLQDLLEADDFCVFVHYNILYDPTAEPTDSARDLFLIRLMDGATELGVVSPYPYYNDGYDQGIAALYFDAATALTWEEPYTIEVRGSPFAWATPPSTSLVLVESLYSGVNGQSENQDVLYDWAIDALEALETNWSVTLLESSEEGMILDETGQTYMTGAVPGLQALCPQLFWIKSESMDVEPRTWGTAQADLYAARFDGTFVGDGMDGLADLLHCTPQLLGGIVFVLIPFILTIILSERVFSTSTPALITLPLLLAMGALLGFLPLAAFALVVICFVLFIGYILFFRTA